ncbi:MAG: hypothetical protein WCH31_00515 [Actinomycetes bacterium]
MRLIVVTLATGFLLGPLAATAAAATARSDKLSPSEETWVKPLLTLWNTMNGDLKVIGAQAAAKNALVPGTKDNLALIKTLAAMATCSKTVAKAGPPPSQRLNEFENSLSTACVVLGKGAHEIAQGIGAIQKNQGATASNLFKDATTQLQRGTAQLAAAQKQLVGLGGSGFAA